MMIEECKVSYTDSFNPHISAIAHLPAILAAQVRKIAEETRISIRNERRDAMKQIDSLIKDKSNSVSEDEGKGLKSDTDDVTKKLIGQVDSLADAKAAEIETL